MSRSDGVYIEDILDSIGLIYKYIGETSEFDFVSDVMLQDAVIRRFEIIGEASGKISTVLKDAHPGIRWGLIKLCVIN